MQTDGLAGNEIVAYSRAANGTLTEAGVYPTEGLGGQLTGSVVDHTASQGALAYDRAANLLLAVNAGSNTISVFTVNGDSLKLREVVDSAGKFPVSLTTDFDQAYVLNAEEGGSIQGYQVSNGYLAPIWQEHRALGLPTGAPGESSQFTHTPAQVAFNPRSSRLTITTKLAGQEILVFPLVAGEPTAKPVVTPDGSNNPFAVAFTSNEVLLLAQAGTNSLASFQQLPSGALKQLDEVPTGQAATCWVAQAGFDYYASNAGSGTVTGFSVSPSGHLTDLGNTPTHGGTVDAAGAGQYLYVQGGAEGTVDEFRALPDGALESLGSVTVPGAAGGEGIVAL